MSEMTKFRIGSRNNKSVRDTSWGCAVTITEPLVPYLKCKLVEGLVTDWEGRADVKEFFNPHILGMKLWERRSSTLKSSGKSQ